MKNISTILESNTNDRAMLNVKTVEQFNTFAHKKLSNYVSYDFDVTESLCENLISESRGDVQNALESLKAFTTSMYSQTNEEHDIETTVESKPFILIFDTLSVFDALYDLWLEYNTETWYSKHIASSIDAVKLYTDQYASSISRHHKQFVAAKLDIDDAEVLLKGKQFATVIKRSVEWKQLKAFMKKASINDIVKNETASGAAIVRASFKLAEDFVKIVASK